MVVATYKDFGGGLGSSCFIYAHIFGHVHSSSTAVARFFFVCLFSFFLVSGAQYIIIFPLCRRESLAGIIGTRRRCCHYSRRTKPWDLSPHGIARQREPLPPALLSRKVAGGSGKRVTGALGWFLFSSSAAVWRKRLLLLDLYRGIWCK